MSREEALHGVAQPAVELSGDRPTIVFTTSIANAHRLAEIVDRYAGRRAAVAIDSTLPPEARKQVLRQFETGERQFLINVGIATEGYDHPPTSCIVLGRPTQSRALMTQMIGRGTRGGPNRPIAGKTDCLVIDFVGATERHDMAAPADALAGDVSDDERDELREIVREAKEPMSIDEAKAKATERRKLQEERDEIERQKRKEIKATVKYAAWDANPYVSLGVKRDYMAERYGYAPATQAQMVTLQGMVGDKNWSSVPPNLSKSEASRLIGKFVDRRKAGLCSYKQLAVLKKRGIDADKFSFRGASKVIDALAQNNWRSLPAGVAEKLGGGE
jgi:superfamily II DNA/RNA helicase